MTSFADIWAGLQQSGQPPPYLLIDCAGIDGGEARIPREIFAELECLFTGDLAIELANVGPYLGRLVSYDSAVKAAVEDLLIAQVAMLVTLQDTADRQDDITFSQLHRHFRKFNVVYDPAGKPLFFRYYDSRVLFDALNVLETEQANAFFGPVDAVLVIDPEGWVKRCFRRAGKLEIQT